MFGQKKIAMVVAEFLGVGILTTAFYAVAAQTRFFSVYTGLAAGTTLALLMVSLAGVCDGQFNPAVTISMWVMRRLDTARAVVNIAAQMLGGLAAWALLDYFLGHSLTSVAGQHFAWKVFTAEAVGTAVFSFGAAAAMMQKLSVTGIAVATGVAYAVGIVVASLAANGIINPAVALGVQSWDWSYAAGPIAGAVVGSNIFALLYMASKSSVKKSRR